MPVYRFYCLDGAGHISLADWIKTADDREAIGKARKIAHGARMCEFWDRDRLIAVLKKHELA